MQELHDISGFTLDEARPEEDRRVDEGLIRTLAWNAASIATSLTCFRDDGLDSVGAHRHKSVS